LKLLGFQITARHYVALGLLAVLGVVYLLFLRDRVTLEHLAGWRDGLDGWVGDNRLLSAGLILALGIAATSTPLPLAGIYAVGSGFVLGTTAGLAVALPASAAGATVGMLVARYFFGPDLRASLRARLQAVFRLIEDNGAIMVFSLRMVPVVPFFLINTVTGLTRLRTLPFLSVTVLGMLPVTALLVFAGAQIARIGQGSGESLLSVTTIAWLSVIGLSFLVFLPIAKRRLAGSRA
jgi:uncharacterized membrane protein YdjX (TVP38/TMEM64 family)